MFNQRIVGKEFEIIRRAGRNLAEGAQGAANLADQTLNMHVMAVLSKEFSQRVGGTNVGGYLQTALANKNGELVIPVIVTGLPQFLSWRR